MKEKKRGILSWILEFAGRKRAFFAGSVILAILGVAAASGRLGIAKEIVLSEIEGRVPAKYIEANKAAFQAGAEIGAQYAVN